MLTSMKDALVYNSGFNGSAAEFQSAFPTMPEEEKQKYYDVNSLLGEIDDKFKNMQGDTINRYINNYERTYKESVYSSPLEKLQKNQQKNSEFDSWLPGYANGDIIHGPTHALVGEAGPEAIIPLSAARRGRGLSLWQKAGQMMGVSMFADGGIVGDISQAGTGGAFSISLGGVNISVSADGGDSGNIVAAIKSALPEVTNTIAAELAQMLSKTFQNMPNRVEGVA